MRREAILNDGEKLYLYATFAGNRIKEFIAVCGRTGLFHLNNQGNTVCSIGDGSGKGAPKGITYGDYYDSVEKEMLGRAALIGNMVERSWILEYEKNVKP